MTKEFRYPDVWPSHGYTLYAHNAILGLVMLADIMCVVFSFLDRKSLRERRVEPWKTGIETVFKTPSSLFMQVEEQTVSISDCLEALKCNPFLIQEESDPEDPPSPLWNLRSAPETPEAWPFRTCPGPCGHAR